MNFTLAIPPLLACGLSMALCRGLIRAGPKLGLMDVPDERRVHVKPVARAGGIGIWLAFLAVILLTPLCCPKLDTMLQSPAIKPFLVSSILLMAVGVADDRWGLRPWWKLLGQIASAWLFFLLNKGGQGNLMGFSVPAWIDLSFFIAWTVLIINAYNLIDGLDGLCSGIALIGIVAMGVLGALNQRTTDTVLMMTMGAALLGFMVFNQNPARLFLGDAGSMLLGFFIACFATHAVGRKAVVGVMLLPIAVAGIPLLDVLLAVWRRSARNWTNRWTGKSGVGVFEADKDHLHHRLLAGGLDQKKTARLMHLWAIVLTVVAFLPMLVDKRVAGLSLVGFLVLGLNGMRHFARVEMIQSGRFMHLVVKRPEASRHLRFGLFFLDTVILGLSATGAMMLESNLWFRNADSRQFGLFVVLFLVVCSLSLRGARIYRRVWARATVRDFLSVSIWLAAGGLVVMTLFQFALGETTWSAVRLGLLATALSGTGILLLRTAPDLLRELATDANHRRAPRPAPQQESRAVVVLGAGDLGNLLAEHVKTSIPEAIHRLRVVGFIDDKPHLQGRLVRGFPVLGTSADLENLAQKFSLHGVVLAVGHPPPDQLASLRAEVTRLKLSLYEWAVGLRPPLAACVDEKAPAHQRPPAA